MEPRIRPLTFRCHSGFVPPRRCSGGTNPLADAFRQKHLSDRANVPARVNVLIGDEGVEMFGHWDFQLYEATTTRLFVSRLFRSYFKRETRNLGLRTVGQA